MSLFYDAEVNETQRMFADHGYQATSEPLGPLSVMILVSKDGERVHPYLRPEGDGSDVSWWVGDERICGPACPIHGGKDS